MSLEEISQKEIFLDRLVMIKNTHLRKSCVTMTYLMVKFDEKTS